MPNEQRASGRAPMAPTPGQLRALIEADQPGETEALRALLESLGRRVAVAPFADLGALRRDVRALQDALVLRGDLERAKGILGQRMRLSGQEAHGRLATLAKRDRCTLGEAAARVIAANTFFSELEDLT